MLHEMLKRLGQNCWATGALGSDKLGCWPMMSWLSAKCEMTMTVKGLPRRELPHSRVSQHQRAPVRDVEDPAVSRFLLSSTSRLALEIRPVLPHSPPPACTPPTRPRTMMGGQSILSLIV